jgi:uncharacterized protein
MDQPEKSQRVSKPRDWKLIVEKDVQVPMRDGTILYADIFRPDTTEKVPVLFNTSVYQKDKLWVPPADLEEKANPYMNWETVNPEWWCPRGYAAMRLDSRGSGRSPGKSEPSSYQEAVDSYDAIEWVAKQSWCSGSVGMIGISYHASSQWRAANLNPPSLKAIMPWEGRADQYRDQCYHGGIFAMGFIGNWWLTHTAHHLLGRPRAYNPDAFHNDLMWNVMRHDLDSNGGASRARAGIKSRCRSIPSATGVASRCTCAATPRVTCSPRPSTRSSASTLARTSTRSIRRKAARTSFGGSTTG